MHSAQIDQIRDCFVHVLFDPERAARLFYGRLFELAPETQAMFANDMDVQGRILIQSLATIVTGLARFDAVAPTLRDLAIRHVRYGVRAEHYPLVGTAIVDMMTVICGDAFDADSRAAWTQAYMLIAATMIDAAYPTEAIG